MPSEYILSTRLFKAVDGKHTYGEGTIRNSFTYGDGGVYQTLIVGFGPAPDYLPLYGVYYSLPQISYGGPQLESGEIFSDGGGRYTTYNDTWSEWSQQEAGREYCSSYFYKNLILPGGIDQSNEERDIYFTRHPVNRAIHFLGNDYCLIGSKVYVYDYDAGKWSLSYDFSSYSNFDPTGLYAVYIDGIPYLVMLFSYISGVYILKAARFNGITESWEIDSPTINVTVDLNTGIQAEHFFYPKNRLYIVGSDTRSIYYYDFREKIFHTIDFHDSLDSYAQIKWDEEDEPARTWASQYFYPPMDFVTYCGKLYFVCNNGIAGIGDRRVPKVFLLHIANNNTIYYISTLGFTTVQDVEIGNAVIYEGTRGAEGRPLLFVDNDYNEELDNEPVLYVMTIDATDALHTNITTEAGIFTAKVLMECCANPALPTCPPGCTGLRKHGFGYDQFKKSSTWGIDGGLDKFYTGQTGGSIYVRGPHGFINDPFRLMKNSVVGNIDTGEWGSLKSDSVLASCHLDQKDKFLRFGCEPSGNNANVLSVRYTMFGNRGLDGTIDELSAPGYRWDRGGGTNESTYSKHLFAGSGVEFQHLQTIKSAARRAPPHERIGGGARHSAINSNGEPLIDINFERMELGESKRTRIYYNITPTVADPAGRIVAVRWFYNENYLPADRPCTIIATSDGVISSSGSLSNYLVTNIIAESGKTYSVEWDSKTDGVTRNGPICLMPLVYTGTFSETVLTSPDDLPGLTMWFDASDISTIISGVNGINGWLNKSSSPSITGVYQYDISSMPEIHWNANNGMAGIRFDDSNQEFIWNSGDEIGNNINPINGLNFTSFIVFETDTVSPKQCLFSMSNNNYFNPSGHLPYAEWVTKYSFDYVRADLDGDDILCEAQDFIRVSGIPVTISGVTSYTNAIPRTIGTGNVIDLNVGQSFMWKPNSYSDLLAIIKDYPDAAIYGTESNESITNVSPSSITNISFGRYTGAQSGIASGPYYYDAGEYFSGTLLEFFLYNRPLMDGELRLVYQYINNKWDIYG